MEVRVEYDECQTGSPPAGQYRRIVATWRRYEERDPTLAAWRVGFLSVPETSPAWGIDYRIIDPLIASDRSHPLVCNAMRLLHIASVGHWYFGVDFGNDVSISDAADVICKYSRAVARLTREKIEASAHALAAREAIWRDAVKPQAPRRSPQP